MKVSVTVTLYNGEAYLIEQLESIRYQTYTVDEVILCDDGSTDNTYTLADNYIKENELSKSWKLSKNVINLGYATNFYEAIKKTSGEYVFFCDQDDIWIDDRIEKMLDIMDRNMNIQMLGSEFEPFSCTSDAPSISKGAMRAMNGDGSLEHIPLNSKTIFIGSEGCTMCIRRSFFEKIEVYWFNGWAHDEFVWKLALCMDGCYIYHQITLKRRLHSSNVSKRKMRDLAKRVQFLENLKRSHEQMLVFANDIGMDRKSTKLIRQNIKSVNLRIGLLSNKEYMNVVSLLIYHFNNYHSRKSILVEFYLALKVK